jgi:hypothetical protein
MNSKLLAFNLAQDLPGSEIDATNAHYDAQEQVWVDSGRPLTATSCGTYTSYASSCSYKLKAADSHQVNTDGYTPNTDGYGVNTDGYTANTDGYGVNTDGYTANTDGYGVNTDGYTANTDGYGVN